MNEQLWSVVLGQSVGPVELGLPRDALLQRLEKAKLDFEADDIDPEHVFILDMEAQLTLRGEGTLRLVQIAVNDEQVRFGSEPVIGRRLHEITKLLQVNTEETIWRIDDDPDDSLPSPDQEQQYPVPELELLLRGTLWIRPLGLGLSLWQGRIREVYLRQPEQTPSVGIGKLSQQQLVLSEQTDFAAELDKTHQAASRLRRWFRLVTGIAFFGLIGWVVMQAAQYQRRWQEAPKVEAEVVAIRPDAADTIATEFVVTYRDNNDIERQANLGLADVYVPKAVGEKVEVRYLPEEPDRPLGPGRVHDAAFVRFFPWGIGVLVGYLLAQIAGAIVIRLATKPAPLTKVT